MKAIVAVDENWGIGYKGNLLERIPDDMKFFKKTTLNKVVVMGRNTFESFPGQNPLKNRTNVVLSRTKEYPDKDIILCKSEKEVFKVLKNTDKDDIFIIGGENIYKMFLPYCDEVYVTKIHKKYEADKYFVNLDNESDWQLVKIGEKQSYNGIDFKFCIYKNKKQIERE